MDQEALLMRLTAILKQNGDQILTGDVPLSLSTSFLHYWDEAFKSVSGDDEFCASFEALPGSSPRVPHWLQLQFLYDFIQKTPRLKLIPDPGYHGDREHTVSMSTFRSLRELELKRLQVDRIAGLSRLRGRLKALLCSRCLSTLQDVLERCGADRSEAFAWVQLTRLSASFNNISRLDSSLRLAPVLQTLDLSHNLLEETSNHLEHLTELLEVNLGYNMLTTVPTFSVSSHARLSALSLQNNCLEDVEGVQDLVGLRQLDLSHNCLLYHDLLQPLRVLHKLQVLLLVGNPLSEHAKHRHLTLSQTSPNCLRVLILDRKPVTEAEFKTVSSGWTTMTSAPLPRTHTPHTRQHTATDHETSDPDSNQSDGPEARERDVRTRDDVTKQLALSPPKSPSRGKKSGKRSSAPRKPRTAQISVIEDASPLLSDSCDYSSSYTEEQSQMRSQVQHMRGQYGEKWLRVAVAGSAGGSLGSRPAPGNGRKSPGGVASQRDSGEGSANQKPSHKESTNQRQAEILKANEVSENSINKCQEQERTCRGTSDRTESEKIVIAATVEHTTEKTSQASEAQSATDTIFNGSKTAGIPSENSNKSVSVSEIGLNRTSAAAVFPSSDSKEPAQSLSDLGTEQGTASARNSDTPLSPNTEGGGVFSWSKAEQETQDYGPESEPFIVTLGPAGDGNHANHFLVTVTERFLVEKDDSGTVTEALDLRCLLEGRVLKPNIADGRGDDPGSGGHVVELRFDYYRKDRCERRYIMEDGDAATGLLELVEPFIDMRNIEADLKDRVKCLKCEAEFSKTEKTLAKKSGKGSDAVLTCPVCQSDKVVAVDLGQVARSVGHRGVTKLDPDTKVALHEPTSHSTPVKDHTNRQLQGYTGPLHKSSSARSLGGRTETMQASSLPGQDTAVRRSTLDVSTDSGITILPAHGDLANPMTAPRGTRTSSVSSDIAVLGPASTEDHSLSPIMDRDSLSVTGPDGGVSPELTPCGSLSDRTIHSMVSSVYEKSLPSHGAGAPSSGDSRNQAPNFLSSSEMSATEKSSYSEPAAAPEQTDPALVRFSHDDYSTIDHRLRLHLDMSFFQSEEQFQLMLQCDVVQYLDALEYRGLLVITSQNFYVFRLSAAPRAESISNWLSLVHKQSLEALCYLEIGYGGQSFRFETGRAECSFTFLVRDEQRCKRFLKPLTALVQSVAFSAASSLEGIRRDQTTPDRICQELLEDEAETDIRLYVMCHQQIGAIQLGEGALTPVSIVVTPTKIAMATEYHHLSRRSADLDASHDEKSHDVRSCDSQQFELKDVQLLSDLTGIELSVSQPCDLGLTFTEESTGDEYTWRLLLATAHTRDALVAAVRTAWELMFQVQFDVIQYC